MEDIFWRQMTEGGRQQKSGIRCFWYGSWLVCDGPKFGNGRRRSGRCDYENGDDAKC